MTNLAREQKQQLQQLKDQIGDIAISFGWDPSESWVMEIKRRLGFYEPLGSARNDIHELTYMTYKQFDPRYYYTSGRTPKVTARYTEPTDPSPLDIAARCMYDPRYVKIGKIVVGSHTTSIYEPCGFAMFVFDGFGRKMHLGSAERSENARLLIRELTGLDLKLEDIALPDMSHFYEQLVIDKNENGAWQVNLGETVRA